MKYAVIQTGGKQYKIEEGQVLTVEKIDSEKGKQIIFDSVLLYVHDDSYEIGRPTIKGFSIQAEVVEQKKDEKIRVAKFKAKARYRRVQGHRQEVTTIKIGSFGKTKEENIEKTKEVAQKTEEKIVVSKTKKTAITK